MIHMVELERHRQAHLVTSDWKLQLPDKLHTPGESIWSTAIISAAKKLLLERVRNRHKAAQLLLVHLKDTWKETKLTNTGPSLQTKFSFPFCSLISRKSSAKWRSTPGIRTKQQQQKTHKHTKCSFLRRQILKMNCQSWTAYLQIHLIMKADLPLLGSCFSPSADPDISSLILLHNHPFTWNSFCYQDCWDISLWNKEENTFKYS